MKPQTPFHPDSYRNAERSFSKRFVFGLFFVIALTCIASIAAGPNGETISSKQWTDSELVDSYSELVAQGLLAEAVASPVLPSHPPQTQFLDALAWYAAGTPEDQGTLTIESLDDFLHGQALWYIELLRNKVEEGDDNDYARTRTWKVIQKLTLLREQMLDPSHQGQYTFPAIELAPPGNDPWEQAHTLDSPEEFRHKVCGASHDRPVLVKFGNTNCTQCMLFEMIGSVKELAESPRLKDTVDVYKVWWGLRPDRSFAGKVRDPARLDALAKAEGVSSSPYFIVYRNGRRYPCGDAFPDSSGPDEHLASCLDQSFEEVPIDGACASADSSTPST